MGQKELKRARRKFGVSAGTSATAFLLALLTFLHSVRIFAALVSIRCVPSAITIKNKKAPRDPVGLARHSFSRRVPLPQQGG